VTTTPTPFLRAMRRFAPARRRYHAHKLVLLLSAMRHDDAPGADG
jgi:deoxyribodipyrimidine photolyase-like uncharacterized protein